MVTTIRLDSDFHTVIKDLISLDYDAAEAYQVAIERLEREEYKYQLAEFKDDHLRYIGELSAIVRGLGMDPPQEPDMEAVLTKGKYYGKR